MLDCLLHIYYVIVVAFNKFKDRLSVFNYENVVKVCHVKQVAPIVIVFGMVTGFCLA